MTRLAVVKDPADVLHKAGKRVEKIDSSVLKLVQDMFETMREEKGVGLAGPQINKSLQLFVVEYHSTSIAMINPEIYWLSKTHNVSEEGCLSIPGKYMPIKRPTSLKIRYTDLNGKNYDEKIKGYIARIIQHEYDHVNGILITDRYMEQNPKSQFPIPN